MKSLFVFVILLIFVSGCSQNVQEQQPPAPLPETTSFVSVETTATIERTPTAIPYAAPTIEKITKSRYKKPTITQVTPPDKQLYDPIIGRWGSGDDINAIFTTTGSGNSNFGVFYWNGMEGSNYSVVFYGGESIVAEYNENDTLSLKGYILGRM